ncbi:hypothetical protein ACH5RR_001419 [Cinchona calisaya]|uniref:Uncharacterized protein n=1 Tax=Cinchona calisaya TaxID=153742 RepID=A0ABD3B449_9GENT
MRGRVWAFWGKEISRVVGEQNWEEGVGLQWVSKKKSGGEVNGGRAGGRQSRTAAVWMAAEGLGVGRDRWVTVDEQKTGGGEANGGRVGGRESRTVGLCGW